jgi:hypothetical protein
MSPGELALVIGAVLCALAFAALAVTLVRVRPRPSAASWDATATGSPEWPCRRR